MKKRHIYIIVLFILFVVSQFILPKSDYSIIYNKADRNAIATVQTLEVFKKEANFPKLHRSFIAFKEALAFKESRGDYNCVNTLGYLGKYQFGRNTLARFRIYNTKGF